MSNILSLYERATLNWDGAWITPTGQIVELDPNSTDPIHHAEALDDHFPDLYDLHDEAVEAGTSDEDDYRFFAVEYGLERGWMRLRFHRDTMELSVQFTKALRARALAALSQYLSRHSFKTFVLETRGEAYPNQSDTPHFDNERDFMRAVNAAQASLRA